VIEGIFVHVLEQSGVESQINVLKKSQLVSRLVNTHNNATSAGAPNPNQSRADQQYPSTSSTSLCPRYLPIVYTLSSTLITIAEAHPQVTEYLGTVDGLKDYRFSLPLVRISFLQ